MAFQTKVGSIASPAASATGQVAYTGVGFQPKAIIFFSEGGTGDGTADGYFFSVGMATSTTSRAAVYSSGDDNFATTQAARGHAADKCIAGGNAAGFFDAADLVSFDSDGFTLNWTTNDAFEQVYNYIALGGSHLSNATIKQFQAPAATGVQAYTGVGFRPECIFVIGAGLTDAPGSSAVADAALQVGFATATHQGVTVADSDDNAAAANSGHGQSTAATILMIDPETASVHLKASCTSLDADGFTLTWANTVENTYFWALCLDGGNYTVGQISQKTSTGTQAYTGIGFRPRGLIFTSANDASDGDLEDDLQFSLGAASATNEMGAIWIGDNDAADPTQSNRILNRAAAIVTATPAATPTITGVATLSSFGNNGFTLNWTTADGTARLINYLAFGTGNGGGGGQGGGGGNGGGGNGGGGGNPGGGPPGGGGNGNNDNRFFMSTLRKRRKWFGGF